MIEDYDEPELEDDYPVFWDYWYVADGNPVRSNIKGTAADLKRDLGCESLKRCDAVKRGLPIY